MANANDPFPEICSTTYAKPVNLISPNNMHSGGKKSWAELHSRVRDARKLQSNLTNKVPSSFVFRQYDGKTRVYFLGVPLGKRESTIMYSDVDGDGQVKPWWQLLDIGDSRNGDTSQLSKEEQLLQERKRMGLKGLTSFYCDTQRGRVVFPSCSKLHYCDDETFTKGARPVTTCDTQSRGSKLDPKICPSAPNLIAYVANGDLWVYNTIMRKDHRLTHCRKGLSTPVDDAMSAGVPSFIIQEEFDRYTGYWWQPARIQFQDTYRILYEEVDESQVDILNIISSTKEKSEVDKYRYPKAGTINATCTLKIVEFTMHGEMILMKNLSLYNSLQVIYPWMEYIVRAGWLPDGQSVWVQLLDRSQSRLAVVVIPIEAFMNDDSRSSEPGELPSLFVILEEKYDNGWVNVHDVLYFLSTDGSDIYKFIWASETTGHRHLYLCTFDTKTSRMAEEVALTSGAWEVIADQTIRVDETRRKVYFTGNMHTPLEHHLYVVCLDSKEITLLTQTGFSHQVTVDPWCSMVVSTYSSVDTNPCTKIYRICTTEDGKPALENMNVLLDHSELDPSSRPPQLFSCPLDGGQLTMYGMVYKPHNHIHGVKYPTVLFVYGGPQVQLVMNSNRSVRFLRLHTLASLGYAVVVLDGRGSLGRGHQWETHINGRMGTVEIADQVEGLQWLADNVDYIDMKRVAIHGWSYGGYLSLLGLGQRPDIFKVALAGAPVTTWESYDTGYTERYMSTPQGNPHGYKTGSVLHYLDRFPDEENRLLITHGMIDENVHFTHTSDLIDSLVKACKPYQLQIYPNERHGIRNQESNQHFETMVLSFLQQHL